MERRCVYCGKQVDPLSREVWQLIVAWERKASKYTSRKGGSDVALRTQKDKFACDVCVSRKKRGVAPKQGSLIDA